MPATAVDAAPDARRQARHVRRSALPARARLARLRNFDAAIASLEQAAARSRRRSPRRARSWRISTARRAGRSTRCKQLQTLARATPTSPAAWRSGSPKRATANSTARSARSPRRRRRRRQTRGCRSRSAASIWLARSARATATRSRARWSSSSGPRRDRAAQRRARAYGRALSLSGDLAGAERILREAVATSPVDLEAFEYLADAAERPRTTSSRATRSSISMCSRATPPRLASARTAPTHRRPVVAGRRPEDSATYLAAPSTRVTPTRRPSACWRGPAGCRRCRRRSQQPRARPGIAPRDAALQRIARMINRRSRRRSRGRDVDGHRAIANVVSTARQRTRPARCRVQR